MVIENYLDQEVEWKTHSESSSSAVSSCKIDIVHLIRQKSSQLYLALIISCESFFIASIFLPCEAVVGFLWNECGRIQSDLVRNS